MSMRLQVLRRRFFASTAARGVANPSLSPQPPTRRGRGRPRRLTSSLDPGSPISDEKLNTSSSPLNSISPDLGSPKPRRRPRRSLSLTSDEIASLLLKISSSGTNSPGIRRPGRRRLVSSLDRLLLTSDDHLDISERRSVRLTFPPAGGSTQLLYHYSNAPPYLTQPFPQNTAGFLYYHRPHDAAPLEGSVRFRCTATPLPSSFATGHDLLLPSGAPWQLLLPQLVRVTGQPIMIQLAHQQLATQAQVTRAAELFGTRHIQPSTTLFRFDQEFPFNFTPMFTLQAVGEDAVHRMTFSLQFAIIAKTPGCAIARFERGILDGHPIVHMRILRLVAPFVPALHDPAGRYVELREGELLTLSGVIGRPKSATPWMFKLDRSSGPAVGLRALSEASKISQK
ncbi:hypothetical protein C8R46DRAFT_432679 [Mycena filopes]|nr:hypothetical protein C8R46DRAFT_432679 [Mycena filopes]